jgi:hypothetical protein
MQRLRGGGGGPGNGAFNVSCSCCCSTRRPSSAVMRFAPSRWLLLHVLTHFTATWPKHGTRCVPWSTSARAAWRAGESRATTNIASRLTHLCSASDAQGCSNVSCDVFYKRHAAQVGGFSFESEPTNRNVFTSFSAQGCVCGGGEERVQHGQQVKARDVAASAHRW